MSFGQSLQELVRLARHEDLGGGDVTTALLADADRVAEFRLVAKQSCVFAGREVAPAVLQAYDPRINLVWTEHGTDGACIDPSDRVGAPTHAPVEIARLTGPLGSILSAERVLLNFLQRLCGVATMTRRFVDAVSGTSAVICDTRKTTPGWRELEKYAVACGGGINHRQGLYDGVLIKDNHLHGIPTSRLAGVVFDMLSRLDAQVAEMGGSRPFVEVEADTLEQLEQLFKVVGIDAVLLDNFVLENLRKAVEMRDGLGLRGKVLLEASGGITLETVRSVAETGVDRISVGALTHSATAVDLSLERL